MQQDLTLEMGGVTGVSDEPQAQGWMVSFADLMALLLTFMVLGFSMNKVDEALWADVAGGLGLAFAGSETDEPQVVLTPQDVVVSHQDARYMAEFLVSRVAALSPSDVETGPEGVSVNMEGASLEEVAEVLSRFDQTVVIEVRGAMPADDGSIQRQLAWERALSEAVDLRIRLMGNGLPSEPGIKVRLVEASEAGSWLFFDGEGQ